MACSAITVMNALSTGLYFSMRCRHCRVSSTGEADLRRTLSEEAEGEGTANEGTARAILERNWRRDSGLSAFCMWTIVAIENRRRNRLRHHCKCYVFQGWGRWFRLP